MTHQTLHNSCETNISSTSNVQMNSFCPRPKLEFWILEFSHKPQNFIRSTLKRIEVICHLGAQPDKQETGSGRRKRSLNNTSPLAACMVARLPVVPVRLAQTQNTSTSPKPPVPPYLSSSRTLRALTSNLMTKNKKS